MPLFDTHIAVDWSARSQPSPPQKSKDAIGWAAACVRGGAMQGPEYERTRHAAVERLTDFIAKELDAGRRVLAGFDFPFGYPAGVAEHVTGNASALALWDWLEERIEDDENNRYEVAEEINWKYPGLGPFWGRPDNWPHPDVPTRASDRTHTEEFLPPEPAEKRIADLRAPNAKTVWQLAYTGSVGSQTLLGLPALKRLTTHRRIAGRAAVWPFHTGLRAPNAQFVITEIYPSLLKPQIDKSKGAGEIVDAAQVRVNAQAFARLDAANKLTPLFKGAASLTRGERRRIETEEAWILGLGHEKALRAAAD